MFKPQQMATITMVAAVISALILVLPLLGISLPSRVGGNEPLACAMTAQGGNLVGFDISQCALFETLYADCASDSSSIMVTQGSYKDESFFAGKICNLNDQANNKMYFQKETITKIIEINPDAVGGTGHLLVAYPTVVQNCYLNPSTVCAQYAPGSNECLNCVGQNGGGPEEEEWCCIGGIPTLPECYERAAQSFTMPEAGDYSAVNIFMTEVTHPGIPLTFCLATSVGDGVTCISEIDDTVALGWNHIDMPTVSLNAGQLYYLHFFGPWTEAELSQATVSIWDSKASGNLNIYPEGNQYQRGCGTNVWQARAGEWAITVEYQA